jgi:hypothetical protein
LSPDWSAKVAPVPYAKLDNPQSLNLYSYVYNNPINGIDPDGHFASPWHIALTFAAAISVGDNPFSAFKLGVEDALVDKGTQGKDSFDAHIHAMGGPGESPEDAYAGAARMIIIGQDLGDVAGVLHVVQDSYASGHQYKNWSNGYGNFGGLVSHEIGDWFPSPMRIWGAFKASRKALKDPNASPESMLNPVPSSSTASSTNPAPSSSGDDNLFTGNDDAMIDSSSGTPGSQANAQEASAQCKSGNPAACN